MSTDAAGDSTRREFARWGLTGVVGAVGLASPQPQTDVVGGGPRSNSPALPQEPSEGVFDVKAYGAVGDGECDDTEAIQTALDEAVGTRMVVASSPPACTA